MRKYSLPVRVAAFACALCLLLTGCGTVAAPDDSGDTSTPAPTAEPAAAAAPATDETELTTEDAELTEVEKLAAQLAVKHLGEDAVLTDVVELSSGDSGSDAYHVLLLKDTEKNYLAYWYGTGSVYCPSRRRKPRIIMKMFRIRRRTRAPISCTPPFTAPLTI